MNFSEFNLDPKLLTALEVKKITTPTDAQTQAIPEIKKGLDLVVVATTGSGKTLAYLLPILQKLIRNPKARALILAPSREIAEQIHRVALDFTADAKINCSLVIAGIPDKLQTSQLKKVPQLIVATPGRLNEHLRNNKLLLQGTEVLVIDEADRMLDLGFFPQILQITKTMRGQWQTLMFSASFAKDLEDQGKKLALTPMKTLKVGHAERPVEQLRQRIFLIRNQDRNKLIESELSKVKGKCLLFASTQIYCEEIFEHLKNNGFSADLIHGGLETGHRARVLRDFRGDKVQILVTSDLLARGLDVPEIQCVVNYDLPDAAEDFLHRIGRTARAGRQGVALSFVVPNDDSAFEKIQNYILNAEITDLR